MDTSNRLNDFLTEKEVVILFHNKADKKEYYKLKRELGLGRRRQLTTKQRKLIRDIEDGYQLLNEIKYNDAKLVKKFVVTIPLKESSLEAQEQPNKDG